LLFSRFFLFLIALLGFLPIPNLLGVCPEYV